MRSRGRVAASVALVLSAILCAACGPARPHAKQRPSFPLPADTMTVPVATLGGYGGRFVIAATSGPKTFNPLTANETSSNDVVGRMFASLTGYDNATQQDVPDLARAWEMASDERTWTYHLRRGAAFSDGHPITSSDVLFSFDAAYDESLHAAVRDLITMDGRRFEVTAPDSYTVVIQAPSPNALFLAVASAVRIIPRHRLEPAWRAGRLASVYGVDTPPDSLVTSGPFRLAAYVPNEKVVLAPNPYWYGVDPAGHRLPYLDELVFLIVPDQDAADLKFRAGEVDGIDNVKPENYAWYREHQQAGNFTLHDLGPSMTTNCLWFNLNRVDHARPGRRPGDPAVDEAHDAWFRDPRFRRAVSMAIDRRSMIPSVLFDSGVENWSMATAGNRVWYTPDVPRSDYDVEASRRMLATLGMKDRDGDGVLEDARGHRVAFSLKTNADNKLRVGMGNFVRDDLAKVGIQVTLVPTDFNTLITNLREDFDYQAALLGFSGGVPPDPAMSQNTWRSSGGTHFWHVRQQHPETPEEARIDALLSGMMATQDMAARRRAWVEMQTIMNDQCWVVWLPTAVIRVPVSNRFGNVQPTVIPHRILWNIERVFVKPRGR